MFREFSEVEEYLNSLVNFEQTFPLGGSRDRPKLQPVLDATDKLKLSRSLPRCIHVAGTVGKGTVAGYLESFLSSRFKTLSFTSPHLISVKERVRLNGKELEDELWCRGFNEIVPMLESDGKIKLTYFESVLVFYLWVSRELTCECHVVETGLGGKFDATNVLEDTTAVLTRIDFDHTKILGESLSEITRDKCGIIKPDSIVITVDQQPESMKVITETAAKMQASLKIYRDDFQFETIAPDLFDFQDGKTRIKRLCSRVCADYQKENAAVALAAALTVDSGLNPEEIRRVLLDYTPQARQQLLPGMPPILLDTAHNPASFKVLAETLRQRFEGRRINAVIGMMKDKDAKSSLEHLRGLVERVYIVPTGNPRSYSPEELSEIAQNAGLQVRIYNDNHCAYIDLHENKMITLGLVTGSFYVAGDYLKWREHAGIA